jgi:hypothetical protein
VRTLTFGREAKPNHEAVERVEADDCACRDIVRWGTREEDLEAARREVLVRGQGECAGRVKEGQANECTDHQLKHAELDLVRDAEEVEEVGDNWKEAWAIPMIHLVVDPGSISYCRIDEKGLVDLQALYGLDMKGIRKSFTFLFICKEPRHTRVPNPGGTYQDAP